jgi:large subunit ribosomal protein L35e
LSNSGLTLSRPFFVPPTQTGKVKAHELRVKTKSELVKQLEELKKDLAGLRVQQTAGGNSAKVARIGVVRKAIARVLTVTNQKTKASIRENVIGKLPKNMREKKTRAIRRRLTKEQASKKTVKAAKKASYFPKRVYAIKA